MKRHYSLFSLLLLMAALVGLASCEVYYNDPYDPYYPGGATGDRQRANVISGEWQGDFGMYYTVVHPYSGQRITFEADHSYVLFQGDYYGASRGWGKQIDYYSTGPYAYQYYQFRWEVRNGVLYLTYPYDSNLNVAIYDYYLSGSTFTGRMGDSNFAFRLRSLSFNNWNLYSGDYLYGAYDGWSWGVGYTRPRSLDGATSQTVSPQSDFGDLIVERGRKAPKAE